MRDDTSKTQRQRKILVFRLSSLGDVVLSSAVLSPGVFDGPVDWVVAAEFAPLLQGHAGIGRLWTFDRATGFAGWMRLCRQLLEEGYDEVLDLHGSLRTRLARGYFMMKRGTWALTSWRQFSKDRWRLYGLFLFRGFWPAAFRPRPFVERFARFAGGDGSERPDLRHLIRLAQSLNDEIRGTAASEGRPYYCVMPSSRWQGKCWPAEKFLEVIRLMPDAIPVILGGKGDRGSRELVDLLERERLPFRSGVGSWNLVQVAGVLAASRAYLGNDTGLAHLAEALGVPALVIYGPTSVEMGFGPWRTESVAVGLADLGCRPCGKDGRRCYRPVNRYLCMTGIESSTVAARFTKMVAGRTGAHPAGGDRSGARLP